jgi:DNA-binding MarR family transcriptional regulator
MNHKTEGKIKPVELLILRIMVKKPLDSLFAFKELWHEVNYSRPTLSKNLKKLQKRKLVVRDIDTRKYKLTKEGKTELNKIDGIESLESSSVPFTTNLDMLLPTSTSSPPAPLNLDYWSSPLIGKDVKITGHIAIDKSSPIDAATVVEKLEEQKAFEGIVKFFQKIGDVLAEKKGAKYSPDLTQQYYKPDYEKIVKYEQAQIGYSASVLLVFNGAEVSKTIEWEKELKKAAEAERAMQKLREDMQQHFREGSFRKNWLAEQILTASIMYRSILLAPSEDTLENELVEIVSNKLKGIIEEPDKEEIKTVLHELKATGQIKFVPSYSLETQEGIIYRSGASEK